MRACGHDRQNHLHLRQTFHALALLLSASVAAFGESPCDPALLQPTGNPYGYRLRGDRCEGVYVQEVGGSPLAVVSWTRAFPEYDLSSGRPIQIQWDIFGNAGPARLRVQSLRRRMYYRMDSIRPANSKSFTWPTDILSALGIARSEAGMAGIAQASIGGVLRDVYLPLRAGQGTAPPSSDAYSLTLLPSVELKEVYLTLSGPGGKKSPKIKDGDALGYGYYPAERPLEVSLPGVRSPGFYHLEVGATLRSGGLAAIDLWFYHPGS